MVAGFLAVTLPLVGFVSLLLRSQLDPQFHNHQAHFVIFGLVGGVAFALGYAAGEAANRRGDARVLLLSLAFMATGGFMGLHAFGTAGVLFSESRAGFQIAIPVGLLVSGFFAAGSAFVDARPDLGPRLIRQRGKLRGALLIVMATWFLWTLANLPPLRGPNSEAATGRVLAAMAILGTIIFSVSAVRYWHLFRHGPTLLSTAVIACFLLLAEAMIGVAITGERKWHASWWEWHGLIVLAYLIIGFAARREWRDERFRDLYLPTTRERRQDISVLFGDLVGFTSFSERSSPAEVAAVLNAYWGKAAPLLTRRFGGEVEKFIGDGIVATFNSRGDQPDHALQAARAALALQRAVDGSRERASRLAAPAHRREQRRGGGSRDRRRRSRRVHARGRHGQHGLASGGPRPTRRSPDRREHPRGAARRRAGGAENRIEDEGEGRPRERVRAARASLTAATSP